MKGFIETAVGAILGIFLCGACFFFGWAFAASANLECVNSCNCSGRGSEGCTCITATAVKCPCKDCPCESANSLLNRAVKWYDHERDADPRLYPAYPMWYFQAKDVLHDGGYTDKAALEDIKALKKKIESHCCEKE